MSILKLLGLGGEIPSRDTGDSDTIRKIARELDQLDPDRARFLAAFAYLLSRVARADMEITERETSEMERILVEYGGLPEPQAVLVVRMARTQNLLFGGTENFRVAKEFGRAASREERLALVRCLFEVSAADESISTAEDSVVRQVADELGLEHRDFLAVRGEFRRHLAVLKDRRGADPAGG